MHVSYHLYNFLSLVALVIASQSEAEFILPGYSPFTTLGPIPTRIPIDPLATPPETTPPPELELRQVAANPVAPAVQPAAKPAAQPAAPAVQPAVQPAVAPVVAPAAAPAAAPVNGAGVGGGAAPAAAQPATDATGQAASVTTVVVNGKQVVYTQTFATAPDQWTTSGAGSVGLGTLTGSVGAVKTQNAGKKSEAVALGSRDGMNVLLGIVTGLSAAAAAVVWMF
ncbi:hypothetical protein MMC09_005001 [Bachmanniomyces sp. S44760]|nr:hypothetical protein [Bachmanniomyces sp. S44760]